MAQFSTLVTMSTLSVVSFFFIACTHSPTRDWQTQAIITHNPDYNSKRFVLSPHNIYRDLEVEIVQDTNSTRVYLNTHSRKFTSSMELQVTASDKAQTKSLKTYRLQGGQRLLVCDEDAKWLLDTLKKGKRLHIYVGERYQADLPPLT